jgi:hypothetical protein
MSQVMVIPHAIYGMPWGPSIRGRADLQRLARRTEPLIRRYKEIHMKKYIKPSLVGLGLLRDVTKFSCPRYEICEL